MAAVHLCLGRVSRLAESAQQGGLGWLSPAEQRRLNRIAASARRSQFIAGRWFARQLLAAVHGDRPEQWRLTAPDEGPPRVEHPAIPAHISLSHSGDHLACAVAPSPVGLDLEAPRRTRNFLALADVVCCAGEKARLLAAQPAGREALFYECWTLKEAWLKSRGEPLSPGRLAQIRTDRALSPLTAEGRTWRGADFILALVANPLLPLGWIGDAPGEPLIWRVGDTEPGASNGL